MTHICIEVVFGSEGVQKGCSAVIVRMDDTITQTPWLINNAAIDAAKSISKQLFEIYPDKPQKYIGFEVAK